MSLLVRKTRNRVLRGLPLGKNVVLKRTVFGSCKSFEDVHLTLLKNMDFVKVVKIEDIIPIARIWEPCTRPIVRRVKREKARIDDTLSRVHIWRTLFGTEPMPDIEENAPKKYSGTLDFPDDFDFERILRKVKKGH